MTLKRISDFVSGSWCPVMVWGVIYLLFFSTNNSCDGLSYAADIREGVDLFYPHHLLYNAFGYVIARLFAIHRTLPLLCAINALAGAGCLLIVRQILKGILSDRKTGAFLWWLGACWGLMRFATEAETYVIPLVLSLLASLAWVSRKNPALVSLWAAVACLFHQIHFFWWLGLGIGVVMAARGKGAGRVMVLYLLGAMMVPLVYLGVWLAVPNDAPDLFHYVFHDYFYASSVGFSLKPALLLTPVNFVRTFFQVHGYIPALLARYPLLAAGPLATLVCLGIGVMKTVKKKRLSAVIEVTDGTIAATTEEPAVASQNALPTGFALTHLLIALLQLLFAFHSNGNAEFMVMIPFVLLLFVAACPRLSTRLSVCGVMLAAAGMGAWNISLGLIPYHFTEIQPFHAIERHMEANQTSVYVINDYATIQNRLRYYHPTLCNNLKKDFSDVQDTACGAVARYTDRIGNKGFVSRASFTRVLSDDSEQENLTVLYADTLRFDLGRVILVRF